MNFEHLIQINDPGNPLIIPMSREALWDGLMHRVENAVPFLPGLESCTILERNPDHLLRKLDFGAAVIHDQVSYETGVWVRFEIVPSPAHAGGSLQITIEEPSPEHLFLRFAYRTTLAESGNAEERAYGEYVKSAYHHSDVECVRIIRMLAADGKMQ